jgi:hypothetical protein
MRKLILPAEELFFMTATLDPHLLEEATYASEHCVRSTHHLFPHLSGDDLKVLADCLTIGEIQPPSHTFVKGIAANGWPTAIVWCGSFWSGSEHGDLLGKLERSFNEDVTTAFWDSFMGAWMLH